MEAPQLDRWLAAGLITPEQAEAIERFEATADDGPAAPPSIQGGSVLAEAIGSLGALAAAVAAVVGTAVLWDQLTTGARIGIPAIGAILMLGTGAVVPRTTGDSSSRFGGLLWLLGIGATTATLAIALDELAGWTPTNITLLCGLTATALTLVLTPRRREPHLVLALAGGLVLTTVGLVGQYAHAAPAQYGIALVAVGLALMLWAWAGLLVSRATAYLLGGAVAFIGTEMLGESGPWWPVIVGFAIGLGALAGFVRLRHRALMMVGLLYVLVFLVQGIIQATISNGRERGGTGVVLAAFAVGVGLLAGALWAMRKNEREGR